MTYFTNVTSEAITLRLQLEQTTFKIEGQDVVMQKLPTQLAFSRKACSLREVSGGELCTVYVFKRIDMDPLGFDDFARNLCRDTDWLQDQCHAIPVANARACIMVVATGRPLLFVDTEGSSYARYVARLG
jgi:hypothetical protein